MVPRKTVVRLLPALFAALAFSASAREVRVSYYPYGRIHEVSSDGGYSGFGYEVFELLAKKARWTNVYVGHDRPWADAERMIQTGELDVLDCVRKLPGREERYEFSRLPAGFSFCNVLVRTNETRYAAGDYAAWGGVRVGTMAGEAVGEEFAEFAEAHGIECERRTFRTDSESLEALRSGAVDLAVVESTADLTGFRVLESFNPKPYYFCTKKGNVALMAEIDRAMAAAYDENPGWYLDLCRRYYPREDVVIYLPRAEDGGEVHGRYLRAMSDLLAAIGGWNPIFRECAADFSDADFSVPCIVTHVHRTPENLAKFDFPFVPVCRRPLCLYGRESVRGGDGSANGAKRSGLPRDRVYRVGYNRHEPDWLKSFLAYARDHNLAYVLSPLESTAEAASAVSAGLADLVMAGRDAGCTLERVEDCGFEEFDFATPKAQEALRRTLDMSVRYMRHHAGPFIRRIERYAYGIEDDSKVVRAGVYMEFGAVEMSEDGTLRGYVVDYLKEIAHYCGWDAVFVPMTYREAFEALAAGDVDVVALSSPYPERSDAWDVSRCDAGVVRYALKVKADSPLRPNRPDLWTGNRIGYLAGSRPVVQLRNYLDSLGAKYRLVPYDSLRDALADVGAGRLEGIFTVHARESRDYRTIALFPLVHSLLCTNRRRPEIKRGVDAAMDAFAAQNMDFNWWLNNHYLKTNREVMTLDADEVRFAERNRGRKFTISFPRNLVPVASYDERTGEAGGFLAGLFRLIDGKLELDFDFTGRGKADVYVVDRETTGVENGMIVFKDWFPLPTVRVSLPEDLIPASARGIWAVEANRRDEIDYLLRNNCRPLTLATRRDCYRAVASGRAEATIDNLGSARLMIDENRAFRHLRDVRIDSKEWARAVTIAFPSDGDPELRRLFKKARTSISDVTAEKLFLDALIAARRGRFTSEDLVLYGSVAGCLGVLLFGGVYALMFVRRQRAIAEARTRFFFNVSHDVRTPIHAIMGFIDMCLDEVKDVTAKDADGRLARVRGHLVKMKAAGGLLISLVKSVLDMSRIEAGKVKHEETECDVLRSFDEIEPTLMELAEERKIDLAFSFGEIRDRYVYADYEMCSRVFVNIIANALKYTPEGGKVRVRCEQIGGTEVEKRGGGGDEVEGIGRGGQWNIDSNHLCPPPPNLSTSVATYRYTFTDNGVGMSEEFQKKLYEKFAREKNTTLSGVSGLGLGMAIVKSFVGVLGGTIECRSKLGKGTTFTVELPFRVREADVEKLRSCEVEKLRSCGGQVTQPLNLSTPQPLNPSTPQPHNFADRRVLLVDDSKLNREVACYYLKQAGFTVDVAENGREAVEKVKSKGERVKSAVEDSLSTTTLNYNYDLILMDMQMPVMDGIEATKAIRAWEREAKSLELGAKSLELGAKSLELGAKSGGGASSGSKLIAHSSKLLAHSSKLSRLPIIAWTANAFDEDVQRALDAGMDGHIAKGIRSEALQAELGKYLNGCAR